MKMSNNKCTFCGKELETVEHLFYYFFNIYFIFKKNINVNTVNQSGLQSKTGQYLPNQLISHFLCKIFWRAEK